MKAFFLSSTIIVSSLLTASAQAADFNVTCNFQETSLATGQVSNSQAQGTIQNVQAGYGYSQPVELILRKGVNPVGVGVSVSSNTSTSDSSLKRVQMGIFTLGETVLGQARETLGTNSAKTVGTGLISVNAIDGLRFSLDDVIQVIVPQEGDPTCGGGYQACPPSYGSGSPASDGPPSNIISKVTVTCEIDEI